MRVSYSILRAAKEGFDLDCCDDRAVVSADGLRFAVADGVTRSYRPDVVADLLTALFAEHGMAFAAELAAGLPPQLCRMWEAKVDADEAAAEPELRYRLEDRRDVFVDGAATLAAVELDPADGTLRWHVLGDSCVFLFPDGDGATPAMLASMPVSTRPDSEERVFEAEFGNCPNSYATSGRYAGEACTGSMPAFSGRILIMTDALADLFARRYTAADGSGILAEYTALDPVSFAFFLARHRGVDLDDDDSTLVVIDVKPDEAASIADTTIVTEATVSEPNETEGDDSEVADDCSDTDRPSGIMSIIKKLIWPE